MSAEIVGGYVDPTSGQKCGWANGAHGCSVPRCEFPAFRCYAVLRSDGLLGTRGNVCPSQEEIREELEAAWNREREAFTREWRK